MNREKIGLFIQELRKEKKITQEDLAELIPVVRTSVSKWERGTNLPDYDALLRLSEIFGVSINEILYGERINKDNIKSVENMPLELYGEFRAKVRKTKILSIALIVTIVSTVILFLLYYFLNSYNSVKIYTLSTEDQSSKVVFNGIFVDTADNKYFRLDDVVFLEDVEYDLITLYYLDEGKEEFICSGDGGGIYLTDFAGYDEYFDSSRLDYIMDNLYVRVDFSDGTSENLKISFREDYSNDHLIFKKRKKISEDNKVLPPLTNNNTLLVEQIKDKFKINGDTYSYSFKDDEYNYNFTYSESSNELFLDALQDNQIVIEWSLSLYHNTFIISVYDKAKDAVSYSFETDDKEIKCIIGNCQKENELIAIFWDKLDEIL